MNRFAKIAGLIVTSMILMIRCGGKEAKSELEEQLLNQPPFAVYTDSIKMQPKNDSFYFRRAVLLNTNNQTAAALADFKKAWVLSKKEPYALGVSNILLDKNDNAISFISEAIKELPKSTLLKIALARAYNLQNKTADALKVCNEILADNPQQVDVIKIKATLLDKQGRGSEAITILEQAYQLTPYDINLNYELAYRYAEAKNPTVIRLCDSLSKIDTANNHAEPAYYKGIYFSNVGDNKNALIQFDKAIQQDYYYLNAHIEKGRVLYEQKKYTEALKAFKLPNTISPDFADAWYWLGKCQEAMGEKEEAKLNYQRAYGLDKTFTEAKEAAETIKN